MSQPRERVNHLWFAIAIVGLAYAFFMVGLMRIPVPTVDGAIRAVEARTVVRTGQWFPIMYQGSVVTDHPPLYVWLSSLSFKIFGISDFAANVPTRFCAFLTVILTALLAWQATTSGGVALVSALILCLTRDFVLSSVRGYIEPLVECFTYGGLWLVLYQRRRLQAWPSFLAGILIFLVAFSKGPPFLWPFIFFGILSAWNFKWKALSAYLGGFFFCVAFWTWWNSAFHYWPNWHEYLYGQVIRSAVSGRGGLQHFEPFYFLKILTTYYWPWLPFLMGAIIRVSTHPRYFKTTARFYPLLFGILGFGFVIGYSLVTWKFWYYIAPAYPAFALFIATAFQDRLPLWTKHAVFPKLVFSICLLWIMIVSIFPIPLSLDRTPEVAAFKDAIRNSAVKDPVWFIHDPVDHNLIGTSGEWYFDRQVRKVEDEKKWQESFLISPAWIITGADYWRSCQSQWCAKSKLIQTAGKSALVYFQTGAE